MTGWATWCELCDREVDVHPIAHVGLTHPGRGALTIDLDPASHCGYIHPNEYEEEA